METKKSLPKVLTVANIMNQNVSRVNFSGKWYEAFKQPQDRGVWFIWGTSGSGKSTFVLMICKALAELGYKAFLNLLEEETDDTDFIDRVAMLNMNEVADSFWARTYNHDELVVYLKKNTRIKVVVIDSATYFFESLEQYKRFKRMFKDRIIIITGHANGKNPKSAIEDSIMYDAKMKIFTNGYLASCKGRTIGPNGGKFIIYEEGYNNINGENQTA